MYLRSLIHCSWAALRSGEGHVLDLFEDGFVAVFRYAQIFVGDVFPEHFVLDRTRGSQIGQYGFFGQFEGCFRFGHVVDDLIECVDGLGHFVVLRGDDRCEKIIVVQVARIDPLREGHVSQAAGFAHLLEDDGSHAAAVVFRCTVSEPGSTATSIFCPGSSIEENMRSYRKRTF